MPEYLIYPTVDPNYAFPPEIRDAQAKSAENTAAIGKQVTPLVTKALSDSTVIKDSANAAINNKIASLDIIEGDDPRVGQLTPSTTEVVFSVVDGSDRRSWLEVTNSGGPSSHTVDVLNKALKLQAAEGLVPSSPGAAAVFAVVDQDGRRSEIEVGADGRLTQRVIDSIASRLPLTSPADPVYPITTSTFDLIVGQKYYLDYKKFIFALSADHKIKISGPPLKWGDYGTYWSYTPTAAGTWDWVITISDRAENVIYKKTIPTTVRATKNATFRHLQIGDSITDMFKYVQGAVAQFPGAKAVGPSLRDEGISAEIGVEGHSGWSLDSYYTSFGTSGGDVADSPFLFPTSLTDGAKYRGNTDWWKRIVTGNIGYHTKGFDKLARGWVTGGPYLYDNNGYPTVASDGDVIYDPSQAANARFRIYGSGTWTTWSEQPTIAAGTIAFSFSKYLQRFAIAFPGGLPTSVGIFLGTNGPGTTDLRANESAWLTWKSRMDQFVASIRAWSATVPITLETVIGRGQASIIGDYPESKTDNDRNMRDFARRVLATYDTNEARANGVFLISQLGVVPETNIYDTVHPDPVLGHPYMAAWLSGKFGRLLSEGFIS